MGKRARPSQQSATDFMTEFRALASASSVHGREDADRIVCFVHKIRRECMVNVENVVARAGHQPLLFSYFSDATPAKTAITYVSGKEEEHACVRRGHGLQEFLLQRRFVKYISASGRSEVAVQMHLPMVFTSGKTAVDLYGAYVQSCRLAPEMGVLGLSVSHHCFDRACFSALSTLIYRRHKLYHASCVRDDEGARNAGEWSDLLVFTACANHDTQNALKWSLQAWSSKEILRDLFIYMESMRNGFDYMYKGVTSFVRKTLRIELDDEADPDDEVRQLWQYLCSDAGKISELTDLSLRWRNGELIVKASAAARESLAGDVCNALWFLMRFKRASESRWVTIERRAALLQQLGSVDWTDCSN
eukprot:6483258-Amphidinium_carterae.1